MAREPEEMGFYAVLGDDGFPRTVHGVCRLMPEGSVEITAEQAREISADVRARAPVQAVESDAPAAAPSVPVFDPTPLIEALTAQQYLLDSHTEQIASQGEKVDAVHEAVTAHFEGLKNGDQEPGA